jgi:hypothetical protein
MKRPINVLPLGAFCIAMILQNFPAFSNDLVDLSEVSKGGPLYINCDKSKLDGITSVFTDIRDKAVQLAVADCQALSQNKVGFESPAQKQITSKRKEFTSFVKGQLKAPLGDFDGYDTLISTWATQVNAGEIASFAVNYEMETGTTFNLNSDNLPPPLQGQDFVITLRPNADCKAINYSGTTNLFSSCKKVADELEKALELVHNFRVSDQLKKVGTHVAGIEKGWQSFMDDARFQTTLDVWFTTLWYSDKWKSADLQGPPPVQYFVLHPTLIYSYMPDASRGEELKPVPAVEWFGMNWWQTKVPLGFSITSVYNDRPDGNAFLHGLTVHVDNAYSFGMVGTGDERTFFVNLDLMDWFTDKKGKYDKYAAQFEEYRKNIGSF